MTVYALDVIAPRDTAYDLAERLGFDGLHDALSVSVFDRPDGRCQVQGLYETEALALAALEALGTDGTVSPLPDTDWVARTQAGLPPIEAGRFVVHGSHDRAPDDGRIGVLIDAGAAFGTGHHGTTKGCLLMIDDIDIPPATILDLGTGAGILAIAAAKRFPDANIVATDIDADAVAVARDNAARNAVSFACLQADGFESEALSGRTFDLIIANILAGPLMDLAPEIASALKDEGHAILSGILDAQADTVADAFRAEGLRVQKRPSLDGWTSLWAQGPDG